MTTNTNTAIKKVTFFVAVAVALSCFASETRAVVIADLAADYLDAALGQTSDDVGISGAGATWHYYSDTDNDPTNGGLVLLTHKPVGLEGGDGYAGTGTVFGNPGCCGPFPIISNDGLFDGVAAPPAGTLAGHPGQAVTPPEFLTLELRAGAPLSSLSLSYSFENRTGGTGVDWRILNDAGAVLFSGVTNNNSISVPGTPIADIGAGESLWLIVGNGAGDDPGGDQTFIGLSLEGDIQQATPEPSTLILATLGLLSLGMTRRRRRR